MQNLNLSLKLVPPFSSIGYTSCVSCIQDASDVTDFRISQWLTVYNNSVFCWLYCVDANNTKKFCRYMLPPFSSTHFTRYVLFSDDGHIIVKTRCAVN